MKKIIFPAILILFFMAAWVTPSCTKDIYEPTKVKDSLVIRYDTIKVTTHDTVVLGQDSIHVGFKYVLNYATDSVGQATLIVSTSSTNVPTDATYNWLLDGSPLSAGNSNNASCETILTNNSPLNGVHIISMSLTCPDTKKVYTVDQTFTLKLKD